MACGSSLGRDVAFLRVIVLSQTIFHSQWLLGRLLGLMKGKKRERGVKTSSKHSRARFWRWLCASKSKHQNSKVALGETSENGPVTHQASGSSILAGAGS
jgi:hypothetical protein